MRVKIIIFLAVSFAVSGCAMFHTSSGKIGPLDPEGKLSLGPPVTHSNLTLFPIIARESEDSVDYMTLDEGMDKKLVEITEKKSAQVSELSIHNKSDRPIYLLGGEIIVGGKQDRIVAQNTIIPPKAKMPLKSFCVERGRWSAIARRTAGAHEIPPDSSQLAQPKFKSLKALSKTKQRYSAQIKKDQSANWAEVSRTNASFATFTASETLSAVYDSKDVDKKSKPYMDALKAELGKSRNLVGFVVVINGEVQSCDIFRSPKLFGKLRDKLLNSYVIEALTSGKPVEKEVTEAEVLDWLAEIKEKSESKVLTEASDSYGKRKIVETASPSAVGIESYYKCLKVHENYFKKKKK
ncbi:MAG: hypothetical protein E3J72_04695 [Planctomycetota bacterium]|nr:MAG: hypothetical protein E3J72_04695 [Planctomycetota bacterium]